MKNLFKDKDSLLLWCARSQSRFGDSIQTLAFMYLVYDLSGSALAMGVVSLFSVLPNVIVSPLAGVIVDRYNKKLIMSISEFVRGSITLLVPVLILTGNMRLWIVYLISFLVSVAESFFEPCSSAVFAIVTPKEDLPILNSVVTTTNLIARTVGFAISGMIIAAFGKEVNFFINSVTFFISGFISILINIPKIETLKDKSSKSLFKDLFEGISYIRCNNIIIALLMSIIIINFVGTPLGEFLPIFVKKPLFLPIAWSGYLMTINVIGNLVGNLIYPLILKTKIAIKHVYLFGMILLGSAILLALIIPSKITAIILFLLIGIVGSIISIWSFTDIQTLVEDRFLGRVSAFSNMALLVATPLSSSVAGFLIDAYSIQNIFRYIAFSCIIAGVILFIVFGKYKANSQKDSNEDEVTECI